MVKNLTGNRGWLNDDAADSLHRIDTELGRPLDINDAGRSNSYQWELWNLYHSPQRPGWLGKPAYPGTSPHESGLAIDTDDQAWMQAHGGKHGWRRNLASEPWHYIYETSKDTQRPTAPASSAAPAGSSPGALRWYGVQRMLKRLYGYKGAIDNIPGPGTISAFQRFLNANGYQAGAVDGVWGPATGKAAQRWLRARWGYSGAIDNIYGSGTLGAWARAENANWKAYA